MGIGNIGWSGFIMILVALLLVFGPGKLPAIGRAFGRALREFKNATNGITDDNTESQVNLMKENQGVESKSTVKDDWPM